MGEKRINPETGVVEEDQSVFGGVFGHDWQPAKNESGNAERVNPETGLREEDQSVFGGTFGYDWQPSKNESGNAERVNPETGVREEDQSVFGGTFGYDWDDAKNERGNAERLSPESGVYEEDQSIFGGTFGHDWQTAKNQRGNAERVNPETGVYEEDQSIFHGFFGHDWQSAKTGGRGAPRWGFPGGGAGPRDSRAASQSWSGNSQTPGYPTNYSGYYAAGTATSDQKWGVLLVLTLSGIFVLGLTVIAISFLINRSSVVPPRKDQPPGGTSHFSADITSLRFYESGGSAVPHNQRVYKDRFAVSATRFINWELNLKHPSSRRGMDFTVNSVWYRSDNSILAERALQTQVKPNWTTSYHNSGWGWAAAGNWSVGSYRVDLFIEGNRVASGSFSVYSENLSWRNPYSGNEVNSAGFEPFDGGEFALEYPHDWKQRTYRTSGTVWFAPEGGIVLGRSGNEALETGAMAGSPAWLPNRLRDGTEQLLRSWRSSNPDMHVVGDGRREIILAGETAESVMLLDRSDTRPSLVWVITTVSHRQLFFIAFVAPEERFEDLRPTFQHILDSIEFR